MRTPILTAACLIITACSVPAAEDSSESSSSAATSAPIRNRFAFASPSPSTEQGAPGNEDVGGIGPWVLEGWTQQHATATDAVLATSKVPYVYLYIAAGTARAKFGYQDCNVGAPPDKTLCHGGAAFLRSQADAIVGAYKAAAMAIAAKVGSREVLVHVEPDWFQYTSKEQTAPLSYAESASLMNRVLEAIDGSCPSCKIVSDISPWCADLAEFVRGWDLGRVAYGGLVGKYFPPTTSAIDSNTYAQMRSALGKPLIVSNAYGAGGGAAPYERAWDDRNAVQAVANAGVAIVMQPNTDRAHYAGVIAGFLANPVPLSGTPNPPPPTGTPAPAPAPAATPPAQTGGATTGFTFARSPNVNAYWVEVTVGAPAGATIGKVEAIVNGREWHALSRREWGAYAEAVHVPSGAGVVFRAWDQNGVSHDSNAFVWP